MYMQDQRPAGSPDDPTEEVAPARPRKLVGSVEYDEVLESSFLFEAERSGFFRVNEQKQEPEKAVPQIINAPIAVF